VHSKNNGRNFYFIIWNKKNEGDIGEMPISRTPKPYRAKKGRDGFPG
jgi:hypothetical protein